MLHLVHLSSPTFGKKSKRLTGEAGRVKYTSALNEVVNKLSEINERNRVDYIIITGDVAWNGSHDEYTEAKEWIDNISQKLSLDKDRFIICPGNRDVDREAMKDIGYPKSQEESNEMLKVERIEEYLSHRFQNYIRFINSIGMKPYNIDGLDNYLVGVMDLENIRFVGINTAWFSYKDDKNQGMWIGSNFVTLIQEQILNQPGKFTVTLLHQKERLHPSEIGNGENVYNTMEAICGFSDMVLYSGFVSEAIRANIEKEAISLGCGKPSEENEPCSQNICEYVIDFNFKQNLYVTQHLYTHDGWRKTEDPVSLDIINKLNWSEKYKEESDSSWKIELPIDTGNESGSLSSGMGFTFFDQFGSIVNINDYYNHLFSGNFNSWIKDRIFSKLTYSISDKYVDKMTKEVEPVVYRRMKLEQLLTLIVTDTKGTALSWSYITEQVLKDSKSKLKLLIKGDEGTGKSAFLSVLYYRLRELSELQNRNIYPVYIDLHCFDNASINEAEDILENDLKILELLITNGMKCFIILDGFDDYKRIHEGLETIITEFIKNHQASILFLCLGNIELQQNSSKFSHHSSIHDVAKNPDIELQTRYISIDENDLTSIIRGLAEIFNYGINENQICVLIKMIKNLSLRQVDIRTIIILLKTIISQPNVFNKKLPFTG